MPKKKKTESPSGIILYAKQSGKTSFSSLWSIKKSLGTDKVGHTGTLDSFADGLLVVLTGSMTHLVSHITNFKKTYLAVVCFGQETDTLDPTGNVVNTGKALSRDEVLAQCESFRGALLQTPPVFSALHVDGKRASDLVREGKDVELSPRQIFIYQNKLIDYKNYEDGKSYALLEIECSKGTYIRALARDMANAAGSVAHLVALRRTSIGPFSLKDSACFPLLEEFSIENAVNRKEVKEEDDCADQKSSFNVFADIRNHFLTFTPRIASSCGFKCETINTSFEKSYLNGRPLSVKMFSQISTKECDLVKENYLTYKTDDKIAVFYEDESFAGITEINHGKLSYGFVVPKPKTSFKVFSWQQIVSGDFPEHLRKGGCAITVGSFDALHLGHQSLLDSAMSLSVPVKGVVTFLNAFKGASFEPSGNVMSYAQRLEFFKDKGLDFAIVIDFSKEFSTIEGVDFFKILKDVCNVKYIVEGNDFCCGYKGTFNKSCIESFAEETGLGAYFVNDVFVDDKRVSSTRVRESVFGADFALAQRLIGRPFSLDVRFVNWRKEKDSFCAKLVSQILPKDGEYNVLCLFKDGKSCDAVCSVSEEQFFLKAKEKIDVESVDFIQF